MQQNPFQNTKASYFEDNEIVENWVSLEAKKHDFFDSLMIPSSAIPIRILGGKGSGKTHILRYFSFSSQVLNANEKKIPLLQQIKKDGYIGIYIVASGLQVNRFSGRGYNNQEWLSTFHYYINLEFIEKLLKKITQIYKSGNLPINIPMDQFIDDFFDCSKIKNITTIDEFYNLIKNERKSIDEQISLLTVPGVMSKLSFTPLFKIEDTFFTIVKKIMSSFDELKSVKVLYIIDEFENYSLDQQKFFNSLLRHIKYPETIVLRFAGRLNIQKIIDTYDNGEKLLEDSEVKTVFLENIFNEYKFKEFTKKLYLKRMNNAGLDTKNVDFSKTFATSNQCDEITLKEIMAAHVGQERKTLKNLLEDIKKYKKVSDAEANAIVKYMRCDSDWVLEKINIHMLYKVWDKDDLLSKANEIHMSCIEYLSLKKGKHENSISKHENAISKHGPDMKYQLFRMYRRNVSYSGYENMLYMSHYNPRIFLTILNYLYKVCLANEIDMFTAKYIPCKLQDQALLASSGWFWNNMTEDIKDHRVVWAITNLMEFFRKLRRTDKPYEKHLVTFSYSTTNVSREVDALIQDAVERSLLVETTAERKERNSGEYQRTLRIHPMLSPKWELPITTGGSIQFSKEEIEALFLNDKENWDTLSKIRESSLNIPFKQKKLLHEPPSKKNIQRVPIQKSKTNKQQRTLF